MAVTTESYGDVSVIRLDDELTTDNVARFQATLEVPLADGVRFFVLDLEKTEYLDSAGLEAVDDLLTRIRDGGGQVKASGLGTACRKILEITRFDRRIDLFDSLIDAVRSFH
jgi:anti-anti-sigma factor